MMHEKSMTPEEALEHFGVKGMRWGVRKAPVQLSTEDRTLKKGFELQTVTAGNAAKIGDRRVFTSHTVKDNAAYRSTYAGTLKYLSGNADTYTNKLVTTKPLKIASEKAAYDAFKKMYDDDPVGMTRALAESYEAMSRMLLGMGDVPDTKVSDAKFKRYSKKGEDWVSTKGYTLFLTAAGTNNVNQKVADSYYRSLAKQGYDAIVDQTDKKAKLSDDALVILTPKNSVKVKDTVPLTEADMKLARQLYKEQKKAAKANPQS